MPGRKGKDGGGGTKLKSRDEEKLQRPKKYKVVLHNDDFTPMNFVAALLIKVFNMNEASAWNVTKSVHEKGRGIAGVYSKEIAETKSIQVNEAARAYGHPLQSSTEPE
jgi:ATP-dependent Clp protease adaptor protein ClpS